MDCKNMRVDLQLTTNQLNDIDSIFEKNCYIFSERKCTFVGAKYELS